MADFKCPSKPISAGYIADHHETESAGSEDNLLDHAHRCRKNPGHKDFIPTDDFNLSHLPWDYRDDDMAEVIRATADLTVRVSVTLVSPRRPELLPGTDQPYPFHASRGSSLLRTGTGRVWRLLTSSELWDGQTCPCQRCRHSDTPSRVWGFIYVNTATHVVFDDAEARHATCRFFFDRWDSPQVTADGCSVDADVINDKCRLKLVTCDVNLLQRLKKLRRKWRGARARVNQTKRTRVGGATGCGTLTFIVSHPHGCPKQVSIGRCLRELAVKTAVRYTYTTCTCPGSSGALVYIVGCNDCWGYDGQIHSGVNAEGENVSGIGGDRMALLTKVSRRMMHS